jgi:hypothetical protein
MDHEQRINRSLLECGLDGTTGLRSCRNFMGRERRMKGSSPQATLGGGVTELGRQR